MLWHVRPTDPLTIIKALLLPQTATKERMVDDDEGDDETEDNDDEEEVDHHDLRSRSG